MVAFYSSKAQEKRMITYFLCLSSVQSLSSVLSSLPECSKTLLSGFPTSYLFRSGHPVPLTQGLITAVICGLIPFCSELCRSSSLSPKWCPGSSCDLWEALWGQPHPATFPASALMTLLCVNQTRHLFLPQPHLASRLLLYSSVPSTWDVLTSPNETMFVNELWCQMANIKKKKNKKN